MILLAKLVQVRATSFQSFVPKSLFANSVKSSGKTCLRQAGFSTAAKTEDVALSKGLRWFAFTVGTGTLVSAKLRNREITVHCKAATYNSRLIQKDEENEGTNAKFDWQKFWNLLKPHWLLLLVSVAGAFVVAMLNIEIPRALGTMINVVTERLRSPNDSSIIGSDQPDYWQSLKVPAMKLGLMYVLQAVFTFTYIQSLSAIGERIASELRRELFSSLVRQDIAFFDTHRTGELVNRLTTDVQDFKSSFKMCISQGLRSTTQTLGCIISMYMISPTLTLYMAAVVPTVIGVGSLFGALLRVQSRLAQAQVARATEVSEEALSNIRTVRAFAMEQKEEDLYNTQVEAARVMNENLGKGIGLFQAGANLFLNGLVLGTVGIGGSLLTTGQLTPGDLMAFLVATQTIQRSLAQMSLLFGQFVRGTSAGARVFEYCSIEPSIPLSGGKKIPYHSLFGEVEFQGVSFAYPSRPEQEVLKDFSLKIPAGKVVALVGTSGGGKSTIASLLERFYDIRKGKITIDGEDIKNLDPSWLRGRLIGFINQEPVLFATTLMENIRYGNPSATDAEVIEAAKLANADDFIQKFPKSYQTVVGERGVTISGGQKQRIAIARALLKNPSILILDEATSALDAESERVVQEALDKVAPGRTVLVVAHRLSTIKNAHIIAVVSNGSIAEIGTHETLKQQKGLYWRLIRQQQQEDESKTFRLFSGRA